MTVFLVQPTHLLKYSEVSISAVHHLLCRSAAAHVEATEHGFLRAHPAFLGPSLPNHGEVR